MIPNVLGWNMRGRTLESRLAETGSVGPGFDEVRLAAAITVLLHHAHGSIYDAKADPLFALSGGFLHFGLLAVLVFFAISGFLVAPGLVKSGKVTDYAISRVLRIFPALIVVVISTMILLGPILTRLPLQEYFSDYFRLRLYTKNILTLTYDFLPGVQLPDGHPAIVNGALWTLHFEVLSYIALAAMSLIGILWRPRLVLVVFLVVYVLYVGNGTFPAVAERLSGRLVTFISLFVYFASGVVLSTFRRTIPYSAALAGFAFLILIASLAYGEGIVAAPLCVPYLVVFAGLSNLPGRSFVRRDLSYGVYLIHGPVLCGLGISYPGIQSWLFVALVATIMTLPLSYLSSIFVEQPALARKKIVARWIGGRLHLIQSTMARLVRVQDIGP